MINSINSNDASAVALRSLNSANNGLNSLQDRISTGRKVDDPKADAANFAAAQQLLGEIGGSTAVVDGLNAAEASAGVAIAAGQEVGSLLTDLRRVSVQASQEGLDDTSRQALQNEFNGLREQIGTVVGAASFNGTNLIESGASDLDVLASEQGDRFTVGARDLSASGLGIDTLDLDSPANAASAAAAIDTAITTASAGLADLGASARRIETQVEATTQRRDSLRAGVGNLVDADLGADAAALAAGQVKQALAVETQAIANAAPRALLRLF